jgi:hypothetical protein
LGTLDNIIHINSDSVYLDLSHVISNENRQKFIGLSLNQDLLFAGFRQKNTFISFGVRQRMTFQLFMDNDLLRLLWQNNAISSGERYDLSHTYADADYFLDYHVGVSIPVTKSIRAGARLHLYQGMANIHTINSQLTLATKETTDGFELSATTGFLVNTAGLPDSTGFQPNYMFNFNNLGVGIDLGVEIQVNKQLSLSASLLDLGKIKYKTHTQVFESKGDSLIINSSNFDFNDGNSMQAFTDSITNFFHINQSSNSYSSPIPTRLMVGADYRTKNQLNRFSLLFSGIFYQKYFEYAAALSYSRDFSKHFTFKANYTYLKDAPFNLGAVLAFQFKPFQFYFYSDNIFGVSWSKSRYVQAGFGINIFIPANKGKALKIQEITDPNL